MDVIIFAVVIVIAVIINYLSNPNYAALRNITDQNVYYIIDGMTVGDHMYTIRLLIKGCLIPKKTNKINCNVSKEYLGPERRGHFRL